MDNLNENHLESLLARMKNAPLEPESLLGLSANGREILLLAAELKSIPVLGAPKAIMRRKYALATPAASGRGDLFFSFRFFASASTFLLILAISGIAYGAANALPGQKLFGLKKTAEQFRVKFAASDIERAYLQVQIAKKRVGEVEKLAKNDPRVQLAALKELSQATELAANEVQTLSPKTIKASSRPILDSLAKVTEQEKNLVSEIISKKISGEGTDDVIALSLKNQTRVSEIKQSVAISSAEEALASLSQASDLVVVSGRITQILKARLTVEETAFALNEESVISDAQGAALKPDNLKLQNKVAVSGKKIGDELVAIKITRLAPNEETTENDPADRAGKVKGETAEKNSQPNSTTPASILEPPQKDGEANNVNEATGGFLIETPLPQFAP